MNTPRDILIERLNDLADEAEDGLTICGCAECQAEGLERAGWLREAAELLKERPTDGQ